MPRYCGKCDTSFIRCSRAVFSHFITSAEGNGSGFRFPIQVRPSFIKEFTCYLTERELACYFSVCFVEKAELIWVFIHKAKILCGQYNNFLMATVWQFSLVLGYVITEFVYKLATSQPMVIQFTMVKWTHVNVFRFTKVANYCGKYFTMVNVSCVNTA